MALIWWDGFENYDDANKLGLIYSVQTSRLTFQQTGRFSDSKSLSSSSTVQRGDFYYPLPTNLTSIAVGISMNTNSLVDASSSIYLCQGFAFIDTSGADTNNIRVFIDGSGRVVVQRGTSTTLGTSAVVATAGSWVHMGVELVKHASAGTVTVYIDGVSVLALTGQNTSANAITRVGICIPYNAVCNIDDFYVCDSASWLGEARVTPLVPNADTAQKDFTPSTGSTNYTCVDESPPSTTDYVSSSTVGAKDLYDLTDMSFTPLNILGVKLTTYAAKDDITTRTIRNTLKSGSTSANGVTKALSSTPRFFDDIWTTDPNTSAAWTKSGVDALQAGMEVVA